MKISGWGAALLSVAALLSGPAIAADEFSLLLLDGRQVKWGEPTLGTGAVVTYAFATSRMEFPAARNCRAIAPIDRLLVHSQLSRDAIDRAFDFAKRMWMEVAQIDFVHVDDPKMANLVIGAQEVGDRWAFADVTRGESPPGTIANIQRAAICFNADKRWKVGFDGNLAIFDIAFVFAHELGHVMGLDHPDSSGLVMAFSYDEKVRQLQPGDIAAATRLYGARNAGSMPADAKITGVNCPDSKALAMSGPGEQPRSDCSQR